MSQYRAPLDDMRFDLFDVLRVDTVLAALGQTDVNRELIDAVLEEGARFTTQVLAPLNAINDQNCTFDQATEDMATPPDFAAAYAQFVEGG